MTKNVSIEQDEKQPWPTVNLLCSEVTESHNDGSHISEMTQAVSHDQL